VAALFDHPAYYDLLLRTTSREECQFLKGCFERYAARPVQRVFEPACGSGRLLIRLAKSGFEVSGFDLNRHAVEYCNARLKRHGLPPSAAVRDIEDFHLSRRVDAAFNLISSFQHLPTECSALRHLQSMAASVACGGLYIIGLQLLPSRGRRIALERWSGRRGRLSVTARVWTKRIHRRRRQELCGISVAVVTSRRRLKIAEDMILRTYTAHQMWQLLRKVGQFEVAATFDFGYDLRNPVSIDAGTQDVVYVLRRR
jgi:SAM-dependent methyltransferase